MSRAHLPRATRYEVKAPVRHRLLPDSEWQHAETVDISHSGVLMVSGAPRAKGDRIEMQIGLSATGLLVADVQATGRVVRVGRVRDDGRVELAATIENYRFERSGSPQPGAQGLS